jgi:coenzyme Q-binding protein COQ10
VIHYQKSRVINLPIEHLYKIVIDVEQYPKFVPWCKKCTIIENMAPNADGEKRMTANMSVGFDGITSDYISFITYSEMSYVKVLGDSSTFEHLETVWQLTKIGADETRIDFSIKFSFKSTLAQLLASSAFKTVSKKIIDSFEEYAYLKAKD